MATLLVEEGELSVEGVIVFTGFDRDKAYGLLGELVMSGAATWRSTVLGTIERNILFTSGP